MVFTACFCTIVQVHVSGAPEPVRGARDRMLFKMLGTVCRQLYDCHCLFSPTRKSLGIGGKSTHSSVALL